MFDIDSNEVPAIRIAKAIGGNYDEKFLMVVGGGLGDRICAEPTVNYCSRFFKGQMSLLCDTPNLFNHIPFDEIFTHPRQVPKDSYLPVYTYAQGSLVNQFFNANLMHSVDFASVSAFRGQLPIKYKQLNVKPEIPKDRLLISTLRNPKHIVIHLGKTWNSRTFPASWWESVIAECTLHGFLPVLIGRDCVKVSIKMNEFPMDYTDKLSLNDYIYVCKNASAIITNDSSPLHFAAAGEAKIAFVPTCRHPDMITHWRNGTWSWRMKPFFKEKMWEMFDFQPNNLEPGLLSELPSGKRMEDFLPPPGDILTWIRNCP